MIQLSLKNSSAVVIGSFNIYVVQPSSLAEMGIIPEGVQVQMRGDLTAAGVSFSHDEITWVVRPDRLALETNSKDVECGCVLARVMQHLRWTPAVAVGLNRVYTGVGESLSGNLELPVVEGSTRSGVNVSFPLDREKSTLNVQVTKGTESYEIALNCHFDLIQYRGRPKELSENLVAICEDSKRYNDIAIEKVSELLDLEHESP